MPCQGEEQHGSGIRFQLAFRCSVFFVSGRGSVIENKYLGMCDRECQIVTIKTYGGAEVWFHSFLTSALVVGFVNCTPLLLCSQRNSCSETLNGKLGGPQSGSGRLGDERNVLKCSENRTTVRRLSAPNLTLYPVS